MYRRTCTNQFLFTNRLAPHRLVGRENTNPEVKHDILADNNKRSSLVSCVVSYELWCNIHPMKHAARLLKFYRSVVHIGKLFNLFG